MKVIICFGTRPEAIKMAPVAHALRGVKGIDIRILNTGQHVELIQHVLEIFDIKVDISLNVMRNEDSLDRLTSRILTSSSDYFKKENPDAIMVHGDTITSMAIALSGFYLKIPIYHVEAGLRSGDYFNPFPEEMNRVVVGRLATYHFAPTAGARENLLAEGVLDDQISITGNTVIDALLLVAEKVDSIAGRFDIVDICQLSELEGRHLVLVTCHRRENLGDALIHVCSAIKELAKTQKFKFLFVLHMNPIARDVAIRELNNVEHVQLSEPMDYIDTIRVLKKAKFLLTDSGGLQEEAPAFGTPVLVLREKTERPEGVEAGIAILVGTETEAIVQAALSLVQSEESYMKVAKAINPYGDGYAGVRIADFIAAQLR